MWHGNLSEWSEVWCCGMGEKKYDEISSHMEIYKYLVLATPF